MIEQQTRLDTRAVAALRERFHGSLMQPGDAGYDQARRVWNGMIDLWVLGGAVSRVPPTATAFSARNAPYTMVLNSSWEDLAQSLGNITWTRALCAAMEPFSTGSTYLNFPGLGEEGESQVRGAYGANYARLSAIKRRYDPHNRFRLNQNITPATGGAA